MKNGDFIEMDYVGRIALTGEVFDVTSAEDAKKLGEYRDGAKYGPALVVVGQGMTPKGVDAQLESMQAGEEREFSVMPDEGFGKRSPELVRVVSMKDFIKQRISPVPGAFVTIDGRQAKVMTVSGGRVRMDFNHPLAGRELSYRVRVLRQLSEPAEMAQRYLEHYGIAAKCSFSEGRLTAKVDARLKNLVEKMFAEKIKHLIPAIKEVAYEDDGTGAAANGNKEALEKNEGHAHTHGEGHNHGQ